MNWQDALIKNCYEVLPVGGEVRIQFTRRTIGKVNTIVPIIKSYPENQVICEEVLIEK